MSIVPYIIDDGDTPQYLKGPFTIENIAQNLDIAIDAATQIASDLLMKQQLELNEFTGQEAARITRKVHHLA